MIRFSSAFFTGFLLASTALAQTSGGVFRGEVRDASSAVVPQAKLLIRSLDNGTETSPSRTETGSTSPNP